MPTPPLSLKTTSFGDFRPETQASDSASPIVSQPGAASPVEPRQNPSASTSRSRSTSEVLHQQTTQIAELRQANKALRARLEFVEADAARTERQDGATIHSMSMQLGGLGVELDLSHRRVVNLESQTEVLRQLGALAVGSVVADLVEAHDTIDGLQVTMGANQEASRNAIASLQSDLESVQADLELIHQQKESAEEQSTLNLRNLHDLRADLTEQINDLATFGYAQSETMNLSGAAAQNQLTRPQLQARYRMVEGLIRAIPPERRERMENTVNDVKNAALAALTPPLNPAGAS